jgi:hypothetical protein
MKLYQRLDASTWAGILLLLKESVKLFDGFVK